MAACSNPLTLTDVNNDISMSRGANGTSNLRQYQLRGVSVSFPFDAYQCQLTYMDRVIESLQKVPLFPYLMIKL